MNVLILSTSPRKSCSTSLYFSNLLKFVLPRARCKIICLKTAHDCEAAIAALPETDTVVFASPVYVDTLPSTTLEHLKKLEAHLAKSDCHFDVYALLNCGFYEGHQCALALNTYALWCARAGVAWRGGIGVGSGVMLGFIRFLPLLGLAITVVPLLLHAAVLAFSGGFSFSALFSGYFPITLFSQTLVWILFSMGAFLNIFRLGTAISARRQQPLRYTTAWFCPRFLFVFMASCYWILRALLLHGTLPWQLFQKNYFLKERL